MDTPKNLCVRGCKTPPGFFQHDKNNFHMLHHKTVRAKKQASQQRGYSPFPSCRREPEDQPERDWTESELFEVFHFTDKDLLECRYLSAWRTMWLHVGCDSKGVHPKRSKHRSHLLPVCRERVPGRNRPYVQDV